MITREQIVSEVMNLVHPKMVPSDKKPTIDELEKILNSEDHPNISIAPDGSFLVEQPNTVGDIADAVMRLVEKNCTWTPDGDDAWNTGCKMVFNFSDGGVAENGFEFCPFCGGAIHIENEADS
jgi:hypothetical protein